MLMSAHAPVAAIRVGVVEDDEEMMRAFAEHISATQGLKLVLTAANREEALQRLGECETDVLLVDIGLPDGSGLDVIEAVAVRWPNCAILVSTVFGDETSVFRAIEGGARGYLLKDVDTAQLVNEIRTAHAGGSPISALVARKILGRLTGKRAEHAPLGAVKLSPREQEVLRLISKGFTDEETARILDSSKHTVRTFVRRIYGKLEVNSRMDAVNEARKRGLIPRG
ncbi:MAG: response regulator transcription factor [Methylobacillus sp.]|jgi:DNA-binding NarL/FixJ family response regulator|nr:response regulator transcription factor [Methylobacillus sp.]